jgi:hypothetical protein
MFKIIKSALYKSYNSFVFKLVETNLDLQFEGYLFVFIIRANSTFNLGAYYFRINKMNSIYFPLEWALSIHYKGYVLFDKAYKKFKIIPEDFVRNSHSRLK